VGALCAGDNAIDVADTALEGGHETVVGAVDGVNVIWRAARN
jgi:hypothetical protein